MRVPRVLLVGPALLGILLLWSMAVTSSGPVDAEPTGQAPEVDPKNQPMITRPHQAPPVRPAGAIGTPVVPCTDPDGCPDLTVYAPSLGDWEVVRRNFAAASCAVQEGYAQPGTNLLLRFTFTTPNLGPGDLIVGAPAEHPEWFEWANCHMHYHFRQYADYRLWTPQGYAAWSALREANPDALAAELLATHPELRSQLVVGGKFGFCVIDFRRMTSLGIPGPTAPVYFDCDFNQGISVGWADEYTKATDGQWFDITNVPDGPYVIEAEVNAEHFFHETNYRNNSAAVSINLAVPTTTRPPTRTPSSTATSNPTATPTPTRTVTASPTAGGTLGGHGFGVGSGSAALSWRDGTQESGYLIVRWSPSSGTALIPADGTQLGASATQAADPLPQTDGIYCYTILPMSGNTPLGIGDLLCQVPHSGSPSNAPGQFTIRLNESILASLSWTAPTGHTGYRLVAVTYDGRLLRLVDLPADRTSATDDTGGGMTCYVVQAMNGTTVMSSTDVLCAVPGVAALGTGSAGASLSQALSRIQGAAAEPRRR